ncbi:MAG: hypothetical protein VB021_09810 [Oscillospiraceae bacterium]|nr:hypothetical protein [Oscillospiraceae bacterium]
MPMQIITIAKNELKQAYLGSPYDCRMREEAQEIDAANYDLLLLRIMLKNSPLTGLGSAA